MNRRRLFLYGYVPFVLLDTYSSNIRFAHSMRKVRTAYAGSCMTVSNGGATLSIGFDSLGNLDEAAIVAFAAGGDLRVTAWADQSGAGRTATALFANAPLICQAGVVIKVQGRPSLYFDGASRYFELSNSIINGLSRFHLVTVCKPTSGLLFNSSVSGSATNNLLILTATPTSLGLSARRLSGDTIANLSVAGLSSYTDLMSIHHLMYWVDGDGTIYRKGVKEAENLALTSSGSVAAGDVSRARMGASIAAVPTSFYTGYISESIAWAGDMSANIAGVDDNQRHYFNYLY
jgi:hypothetical protein